MKNLKKVLALVVALTMVLGTVCFAFTDVTAESDVYTAVQTLSSLSILNGYEDGTFGPEKDITRAEFAAVVCRALNMEGSANGAKGATQFADVPADHWASGYINLAAGQKIVNGYGDGNFGPEDNVTYEQAIKMLVVALGFEPMAEQKGGYPTGYLVVANTYGMTKGVKSAGDSAAANRGVVAQLTYNALDIPMMEQTGFGTNIEYKIQDGNNGTTYKTLLTGLEVAKLEGSVTGTSIIGGLVAPNEVEYKIVEANDNEEWEEFIWTSTDDKFTFTVAEGVNAADYFGYSSIIYVQEVKAGKWEIIAVMPGEDSATIELDKADIDGTVSSTELKYFETETARKSTTVKLDSATVYYNNAAATIGDIASWGDDAVITLIENTGDSKYDVIVAKEYNYGVIDTVEADRDRFALKNVPGKFTFDFEDEEISNTIVNKDGEAITLADFAEGDVVAYLTEGDAKREFDWCEIINLGQNVVSGTVTEVNAIDGTIYVDGVEYEKAAGYAGTINVNDEGIYFLTATNKIFAGEIDASVASNYAYILEMGLNSSAFNNGWQFKLLTKDGEIKIFDVKDTFSYTDTNGTPAISTDDTTSPVAKDTAWASLPANLKALMSDATTNKAFDAEVANRVVTYKLDGNDKIREIRSVAATAVGTPGNGVQYNANAYAIDSKIIEDDAVIFNVVGADMDDAFVTSIESLVHETEYVGYIAQNADSEYDAFVITEGQGAIDLTQDIAIIDSVNKITLDDDDAWKVRYYAGNDEELKELTITADTTPEYAGSTTIDVLAGSLRQGDAIMFAAGEDGIANNIAVIVSANADKTATTVPYTINATAVAAINAEDDLDFVAGYIDTTATTKKGINLSGKGHANVAGTADAMITVTNDANGFTYNNDLNRTAIVAGDWMGADVDVKDGNDAWFFFAVLENGVASDIVTYSTQKTVSGTLS